MQKQVKIYLVGTHGVGKTGLAHALAAAFIARSISTETIIEVARELMRLEPNVVKINEETTLEAQKRILEYQFEREREAELFPYDTVICDRAFDNYLYMERKFGRQKEYEEAIAEHLMQHPPMLIAKVPLINGVLVDDGVRSLDVEFQEDINKRIDNFLKERSIEHIVLPEPVMPYREDWTYRILKKLKPFLPKLV